MIHPANIFNPGEEDTLADFYLGIVVYDLIPSALLATIVTLIVRSCVEGRFL